jgi:MFS family permease
MFINWQGRGPIALVALTIPMALMTIGLFVSLKIEGISRSATAALVFAPLVIGLVLAGLVCRTYGRRLNREQNVHTLYGIPLQHWAWIYWGAGALAIVIYLMGTIRSSQH